MKTFLVSKKRLSNESEKSFYGWTKGYGGTIFSIPKSRILEIEDDEIEVNDVFSEPAYRVTIPHWLYKNMEPLFNEISTFHFKELNL